MLCHTADKGVYSFSLSVNVFSSPFAQAQFKYHYLKSKSCGKNF